MQTIIPGHGIIELKKRLTYKDASNTFLMESFVTFFASFNAYKISRTWNYRFEENDASNTFFMGRFVAFFTSFNACKISRFMCHF
jgi:hypothetical protein